jgi:hypothetical protein
VRHIRGRRSRVVLAPRGLAPSWRQCPAHCADDGGKRNGSLRRVRISRKTTAQGRPVVTACTCGFRARAIFLCARAQVHAATRPSLRPPTFERAMVMQSSGEFRRENEDSYLSPRSLRAQRSNPDCSRGEILDCSAYARNLLENYAHNSHGCRPGESQADNPRVQLLQRPSATERRRKIPRYGSRLSPGRRRTTAIGQATPATRPNISPGSARSWTRWKRCRQALSACS